MSKRVSLYGGTVEVVFDDKVHAYSSGGVFIPAVSSILSRCSKEALIGWAARMASEHVMANWKPGCDRQEMEQICTEAKGAHRRISTGAADIGTAVHKHCEARFLGTEPPKLEGPAAKGALAFDQWISSNNVTCWEAERICLSKQAWYAGTADFFGVINGKLSVGDVKTSSGLWPEMLLQTSAYIKALEEELNERVAQRVIIRVDKKTGQFEPYTFPYSERDVRAFLNLAEFHRGFKGTEADVEDMKKRKAA